MKSLNIWSNIYQHVHVHVGFSKQCRWESNSSNLYIEMLTPWKRLWPPKFRPRGSSWPSTHKKLKNTAWHKASLGEGYSRIYKWGPFNSQIGDNGVFLLLINTIQYNHIIAQMCLLIWTGFSGECCGPLASCFIYPFIFSPKNFPTLNMPMQYLLMIFFRNLFVELLM